MMMMAMAMMAMAAPSTFFLSLHPPSYGLSKPLRIQHFIKPRLIMASTGQQTAAFTGIGVSTIGSHNAASCASSEGRVVVGCGIAGVDYLARLDSFPEPDEKLRSTDLQVRGGGNAGNALTCAARLGLTARLFTKVANDGPGKQILEELQGDGVDISHVLVTEGGNSPFTYIIIDQTTGTRTCIHTPGSPSLGANDVTPAILQALLDGAKLVYLDGRFPDAALLVAEEASKRKLPILVDAERKREGLDEILSYADYIVTCATFPQAWTEAATLGEAMLEMMLRLPQARFVIVTLGAFGCVMLERKISDVPEGEAVSMSQALEFLMKESGGCKNTDPHVVSSEVGRLYCEAKTGNQKEITGRLLVGTAVTIPASELVDTTGAGDAFIGATLYALVAGLAPEKLLRLGAVVAAANCKEVGARGGMPHHMDAKLASLL